MNELRSKEVSCACCANPTCRYVELRGFTVDHPFEVTSETELNYKQSLLDVRYECMKCLINNSNPFYQLAWFLQEPYLLSAATTNNSNACLSALLVTDQSELSFGLALVPAVAASHYRLFWPFQVRLEVNGQTQFVRGRYPSTTYTVLEPKLSSRRQQRYCKISLTIDRKHLEGAFYLLLFTVRQTNFTRLYVDRCLEQQYSELNAKYKSMLCRGGLWINRLCQFTALSMKYPARFRSCHHLECFDLRYFLCIGRNQFLVKCPICKQKNSPLDFSPDPIQYSLFQKVEALLPSLSEQERELNTMVCLNPNLMDFHLSNRNDSNYTAPPLIFPD